MLSFRLYRLATFLFTIPRLSIHSGRHPLHLRLVLTSVPVSHIHWSPSKYYPCSRLLNASDSVRTGRCDPSMTPNYVAKYMIMTGHYFSPVNQVGVPDILKYTCD